MPAKVNPKSVDLDEMPDAPWVQMRVDRLKNAYQSIAANRYDLAVIEDYCAAVRYALFEYNADRWRVPGRLDAGAAQIIKATEHVLAITRAIQGRIDGDPKMVARALSAIAGHLEKFEKALKESQAAFKKKSQKMAAVV